MHILNNKLHKIVFMILEKQCFGKKVLVSQNTIKNQLLRFRRGEALEDKNQKS
jgi:hypothetical protein